MNLMSSRLAAAACALRLQSILLVTDRMSLIDTNFVPKREHWVYNRPFGKCLHCFKQTVRFGKFIICFKDIHERRT